MFKRLSSSFLLTVFAAVSLLGHGGLHLLPGGHDCHEAHAATSNRHTHGEGGHSHHAHGHACSHGHAHGAAEHSHESTPSAPLEHDHDHCVVCQWHAQGQLAAARVDIPLVLDCRFDVPLAFAQVTTSFRLNALSTRGPPLLG